MLDVVQVPERIYPVGRLDRDSEGLMLLTNDGELTNGLLHPSHEIPREYHVWVSPPPTEDQLEQLRRGVVIEGGLTHPAEVTRAARRILEYDYSRRAQAAGSPDGRSLGAAGEPPSAGPDGSAWSRVVAARRVA